METRTPPTAKVPFLLIGDLQRIKIGMGRPLVKAKAFEVGNGRGIPGLPGCKAGMKCLSCKHSIVSAVCPQLGLEPEKMWRIG